MFHFQQFIKNYLNTYSIYGLECLLLAAVQTINEQVIAPPHLMRISACPAVKFGRYRYVKKNEMLMLDIQTNFIAERVIFPVTHNGA